MSQELIESARRRLVMRQEAYAKVDGDLKMVTDRITQRQVEIARDKAEQARLLTDKDEMHKEIAEMSCLLDRACGKAMSYPVLESNPAFKDPALQPLHMPEKQRYLAFAIIVGAYPRQVTDEYIQCEMLNRGVGRREKNRWKCDLETIEVTVRVLIRAGLVSKGEDKLYSVTPFGWEQLKHSPLETVVEATYKFEREQADQRTGKIGAPAVAAVAV